MTLEDGGEGGLLPGEGAGTVLEKAPPIIFRGTRVVAGKKKHPLTVSRTAEQRDQIASQMMALVKYPQQQQAGGADDLPVGEIAVHSLAVDGRSGTVLYDKLSLRSAPDLVFWVQ